MEDFRIFKTGIFGNENNKNSNKVPNIVVKENQNEKQNQPQGEAWDVNFCGKCVEHTIQCTICKGYFSIGFYFDHEDDCKFLRKFYYDSLKVVECDTCQKPFKSDDYDEHKKECKAYKDCGFCYQSLPEELYDEHLNLCQQLILVQERARCNYCDEIVTFLVIEDHQKNCLKLKTYQEETEELLKKTKIEYPPSWSHQNQHEPVLILLDIKADERKFTKHLFRRTVLDAKVNKIWKVENKELWDKYYREKQKIIREKGECDEKFLFHGTGNTDPKIIYTTGFDISFANDKGYYGRGNYFARRAHYSYKNYTFTTSENKKYIFLCKVLTGKSQKLPKSPNIKKPPFYDQSKYIYFDSVTDVDNPQDSYDVEQMYIVYNNDKAYPFYLIEFELDPKPRLKKPKI